MAGRAEPMVVVVGSGVVRLAFQAGLSEFSETKLHPPPTGRNPASLKRRIGLIRVRQDGDQVEHQKPVGFVQRPLAA